MRHPTALEAPNRTLEACDVAFEVPQIALEVCNIALEALNIKPVNHCFGQHLIRSRMIFVSIFYQNLTEFRIFQTRYLFEKL